MNIDYDVAVVGAGPIGLATAAPMVTVELDALVREADRALYGAKHARLEDDLATPPVGQPNRLRTRDIPTQEQRPECRA